MLISSRNNPTIKQIRSLRDRKYRERTGLFFVESLRIVAEAIQMHAEIETLIVAPERLESRFAQELPALQRRSGAACLEVTTEVFESLASKEGYQGIAAVVRQRREPLECVCPSEELCWVALDGVQYPGNLGTILRTCDAVGGAGVFLIGNTADPYDPAAVRASMGAVFAKRLVRTDFAALLAWRQRHNVPVVGTSPSASVDYQEIAYRSPSVLFMGCERGGLPQDQQALCDVMVKIPMVGRIDSLNLAVATSIVLCEMFNQRRLRRPTKKEAV
jgi:TrmH family RNA methyltransferase